MRQRGVFVRLNDTGWRRPIRCLKLQVISCKRASNYRALLRKMTYKDKASMGLRHSVSLMANHADTHVCTRSCISTNIYVMYLYAHYSYTDLYTHMNIDTVKSISSWIFNFFVNFQFLSLMINFNLYFSQEYGHIYTLHTHTSPRTLHTQSRYGKPNRLWHTPIYRDVYMCKETYGVCQSLLGLFVYMIRNLYLKKSSTYEKRWI